MYKENQNGCHQTHLHTAQNIPEMLLRLELCSGPNWWLTDFLAGRPDEGEGKTKRGKEMTKEVREEERSEGRGFGLKRLDLVRPP